MIESFFASEAYAVLCASFPAFTAVIACVLVSLFAIKMATNAFTNLIAAINEFRGSNEIAGLRKECAEALKDNKQLKKDYDKLYQELTHRLPFGYTDDKEE